MIPHLPVIPNLDTFLSGVPPDSKWSTAADLCSAFPAPLVIPTTPFASLVLSTLYLHSDASRGHEAPSYFSRALYQDLSNTQLPGKSILLQYVDDLLLLSASKEFIEDFTDLLEQLAVKGHKVSKEKSQLSLDPVHYLGNC